MNTRQRKLFYLGGLVFVITGLLLLGYIYWPLPRNHVIEAAPATLFAFPP